MAATPAKLDLEALLSAKKAIMRITPDSQFPDLAAYYSSLR